MSIGIGQILIILIIITLFFGNFSIVVRKITEKLKTFKEILKK
jgi:Sec-independent protein translocase protein TatA